MVFYFVQRGETLYAVAKRYQTTVHALVSANRLQDPNAISPGQALIIPRPGEVPSPPPGGITHVVRPGETIFELERRFRVPVPEILRGNQIAHPEFILPGQQLVIPDAADPLEEWPMLGRTPARSGVSPVMLQGEPNAGWTYRPHRMTGCRPSAPVIRYGRVYAALGDGVYHCVDLKTGLAKWRLPVANPDNLRGEPLAAPVLYDGLAYLCGADGTIHARDAHTGRAIWQFAVNGPVTASPVTNQDMIYVATLTGHVYALEVKTGTVIWKGEVGEPVTLPAAVGDGRLYLVSSGGRLLALEAETGEICWRSESRPSQGPIFATVAVLAGNRAYDPADGTVLWETETGGPSQAALMDRVYCAGGVVDLFSGKLVGTYGTSKEEESTAETGEAGARATSLQAEASVLAGNSLLGVGPAGLHARDAENGAFRWRVPLPAPGEQPPAVAEGRVALTLTDGALHTYSFEQGRKRD